MNEQIIKSKSLGSHVRSLSGLFITKTNTSGVTPKECIIICGLISLLDEQEDGIVTKEIKEELANASNHSYQVITNYVNKLKAKGIITQEDKINPIFFKERVIITNES